MTQAIPSPAVALTTKEKIALFFLPDAGDIIFICLLQIPLFWLSSFLFGDGSTGWHLVTGDYILRTHQIPQTDLISYTFPQAPWVAYEWLSDALMALLVGIGGMNLLAVFVACAIGWLIALLYGRCRKEGAHFTIAITLTVIGTIISAVHWLARPHLFTFFGVYLFSTRLEDFYRGDISKRQLLIPLVLYMLLWVNTHPAFLFGFALLAIYIFSAGVSAVYFWGTDAGKKYFSQAKWLLLTALSCGAAALINPYGLKLYSYIAQYLKGSSVLAETDEFMSPIFHGNLQPVCLEILFGLFIIGLALGQKRLSMPRLILCLAFGYLTLSAVRNMPLYVIIILPAISQLLASASLPVMAAAQTNKILLVIQSVWSKFTTIFDQNEVLCNKHVLPLATFIFLSVASINGGKLLGLTLSCDWSPKNKPIATLEYLRREEVNHVLDPNRGFNYDNWGGFLRYKLGTRVFIDDRADFYGEKFYYRYAIVSRVQPGYKAVLDENKIQWVLMPKDSRLTAALRDDAGWKQAAQDEASTLFVRSGG